jgi:glycosyltransferase involved in cell wall biosynthesis
LVTPAKVKSFVHRHVWQRLPYRLRRDALFRTAAALAPGISPSANPSAPIIIVGGLRTASGLGEWTRLCYEALRSAGLPVFGIDISAAMMQRVDADFDFNDGSNFPGPATLIVFANSPVFPLAIWRLGASLLRDKYVIGCWAWELPEVPADWRHGVPFVHEIWVPSTFTGDAIAPIAGGRPVRMLPLPVASRVPVLGRRRSGTRPFTVLNIFNAASSIARKNPVASVVAFRTAFGDDPNARLIVKAANLDATAEGRKQLLEAIGSAPNVTLLAHTMSADEMDDLYAKSDVVISLHRSEGFGLTIAEAMLRGIPAIATDWSGNTDFLTPDTGIPVTYTLVPSDDAQGTYHYPKMKWADADVADAAAALRRLHDNPELVETLGAAGREFAMRNWTTQRYADVLLGHLGFDTLGSRS